MALSETDLIIYNDIRDWVAEETGLKGKKGRFTPRTLSHAKREYTDIVDNRLLATWEQFQELRAKRQVEKTKASLHLKLKVGQQALLACALAEESLAFEAITKGGNPVAALHLGFDKMDKYVDNLRQVQRYTLPRNSDLNLPLDSVVATYSGDPEAYDKSVPRLQAVVGLAIVALHEQTREHVVLPAPGQAPGSVQLWTQPRLGEPKSAVG
jgi:hypothetical protein